MSLTLRTWRTLREGLLGLVDQPIQESHHRGGGASFGTVERRILRVRVGSRFHPGETDFEDVLPIWRGVVEVLAYCRSSLAMHLSDLVMQPRRILPVHVRRMLPQDGRHRAAVTLPRGDCGETVVLGETYCHIVNEKVKATGCDVVPILFPVLPSGLFGDLRHARTKRVVVETCLGIGEVHAPLPLEVHRLVRNRSRTLLHARCVLHPIFPSRRTLVGNLHPRRKRSRAERRELQRSCKDCSAP